MLRNSFSKVVLPEFGLDQEKAIYTDRNAAIRVFHSPETGA
jgi:hypothetical protein